MDTKNIFQKNRETTNRLKRLGNQLNEAQLNAILPNGWSIAVTFAHLGFWDQRVIHVIELAEKSGEVKPTNYDDQLNDVLAPFLAAITPEKAVIMTIDIADKLDGLLEGCSEALFNKLMATNNRWVERSLHRNEHLKDIESYLSKEKDS